MSTSPRNMLAAAVAALALVGSACSNTAEKAAERAIEAETGKNADIDVTEDGYSIQTGEGSLDMGNQLPDEWPSDIALPADFQVTGGSNISDGSANLTTVAGTTGQSTADVMAMFAGQLDGWTQIQTASATGERAITTTSWENAGRTLIVGATDSSGMTEMTISHSMPAGGAPIASSDGAMPTDSAIDAGLQDILGVPDDLEIGPVIAGLEVAVKPERVELDGATLNVYLGDDTSLPQGTECIVIGAVLPDGYTAVVHRDGGTTTC
jgi:hypothetical protein